jgi:hypothetical protein
MCVSVYFQTHSSHPLHNCYTTMQVDLLPRDMSADRVRTWVRDESRLRGLRGLDTRDVHLISCKTGLGVSALMKKVSNIDLCIQQ